MFLTHIAHDCLIEIVTGNLDGSADHRAAQRDHGDVGSTSSDVHDHIAAGLGNVDSRTDCCRDGLLDDGYLSCACLIGSVLHLAEKSSSGGVFSSTLWMVSTICAVVSLSASSVSSEETFTVLGRPVTRFLPLTSI